MLIRLLAVGREGDDLAVQDADEQVRDLEIVLPKLGSDVIGLPVL